VELDLNASIAAASRGKVGPYTYDQTKLTSFDFIFSQNVTRRRLPPPGGPLPGTPRNSVEGGLDSGTSTWQARTSLRHRRAYRSQVLSSISETAPIVPPYHMLHAPYV